jgi:hypothetical protein
MKNETFPVGARVLWPDQSEGVVVDNFKMPGDICIKWDVVDEPCSYDESFLLEHNVGVIVLAQGLLLPKRSDKEESP